jgi:hypothetical protein
MIFSKESCIGKVYILAISPTRWIFPSAFSTLVSFHYCIQKRTSGRVGKPMTSTSDLIQVTMTENYMAILQIIWAQGQKRGKHTKQVLTALQCATREKTQRPDGSIAHCG